MGDVTVLAVTGLNREAAILAGPGVLTLASGGGAADLADRIEALISPHVAGLISIGIAGALDPSLKIGDVVIATGDESWSARLAASFPEARRGAVVGVDHMVVDAAAKAALRQATGALCVDMESHVTAAVAARRGLPFVALRVVSDAADRALPKAAQVGMRPDGGMDIIAVLKALAADPRQLPALIRTGMEAETAFRTLARVRGRLGPALGLADVQGVHLP